MITEQNSTMISAMIDKAFRNLTRAERTHILEIPKSIFSDSYKYSHDSVYRDDVNATAAYGLPRTKGSIISVFGLQQIIVDFLSKPLKQEDVDNLGWKYLSEHNGYLVRYDLRLNDLRLLNDTLYYPPTTAMRNIHMFPPYEKVKMR